MKKLILGLFIIFCITLSARENPFAKYDEDEGVVYEFNEDVTTPEEIQEVEYIKKMQKEFDEKFGIEPKPKVTQKAEEKIYNKKELDKIIQDTKKQTEQKAKEIVKKEMANLKKEPEQVIFVKPRTDIDKKSQVETEKKPRELVPYKTTATVKKSENGSSSKLTILPFLKLEIEDNRLELKGDYEIVKKFSIENENKLVFDYKAQVPFTTQKIEINNKNFRDIIIGNHQDKGYFRVVVRMLEKPSKTNVDVYYGNATVVVKP